MSSGLGKAESHGDVSSGSSTASSDVSTGVRGCWKRRTWSEKMLLLAIVAMFVAFTIATTILVEIYLRLDHRLFKAHHQLTDDVNCNSLVHNWTQTLDTQSADAKPERSICLTPACVEAASRILTSLDPTADPCFDMARFACGGWSERTLRTPNSNQVVMVLENLQSRVDHELRLLLEAPPEPDDLRGDRKMRDYFRSCMTEGQEHGRHASIRRMVEELGGIAHASSWSASSWDLTGFLVSITQINAAPLFDLAVQVDDRNVSRYVLSVGLPRQSGVLPQFYSSQIKPLIELAQSQPASQQKAGRRKRQLLDRSIEGPHPEEFANLNEEMLSVLSPADGGIGSPESSQPPIPDASFLLSVQQISREQKTMAALRLMRDNGLFRAFSPEEYHLEEFAIRRFIGLIDSLAPSDRDRKVKQATNQILNYFSVEQLQQQFGFIDWLRLLQQTVGPSITSEEVVIVHYPELLLKIKAILAQVPDSRVVHNALMALVVRDLALELFKSPPGMEKWQFCIGATKGGFGDLLSGLYVRQFSSRQLENYRHKAGEMFSALKESIVEAIEDTVWLDNESRAKAIRKARNLRSNLVTPDIFFNRTFLEDTANEVDIDGLDFVAATLQMYRLFRRDFHDTYSQPVDETTVTWQLLAYPIIANAFYLQHFNSMVVPLALLNDPLFSMETPRYLSLGTLGFIVAHEIMHGFDRAGVEFDDNGVRSAWMSAESRRQFDERLECIASQYSNAFQTVLTYNGTDTVIRVDGQLTLNENAADLGAIKAIVATQRRWMHQNGPELDLPGLNYTQEQILIINAAQAYCAVLTPQAYAVILGMDEHAPPTDRVNGFLMNLPEMSSIFNCPFGSRLNPKAKCSLW